MKTFHDPKSQRIDFLDERFYSWGEGDSKVYYPSTTHVLSVYPKGYGFEQYLKLLGSNADEKLEQAGKTGTTVHGAIEQFLIDGVVTWADEKGQAKYTEQEWIMIGKFVDFYQTNNIEVIGVEIKFVDHVQKIGGTIDLICRINGQMWIVDTKTGNGIYKSSEMQQAVYCRAIDNILAKKANIIGGQLEPANLAKIDRCGLLHLKATTRGVDKTGKAIQGEGWKLVEVEDIDKTYRLYEHTRAIYDEENPIAKPKNLIYPDKFTK